MLSWDNTAAWRYRLRLRRNRLYSYTAIIIIRILLSKILFF